MLLTILTIIGTLVPAILSNAGVIGPSTATLVGSLLTPLESLIGNIKKGNTVSQDALAALAAAVGVIGALKANTSLPPDLLNQINGADRDVQAALVAYATAGKGLDLSQYQPIAEVK